jgi:hypothetical protein
MSALDAAFEKRESELIRLWEASEARLNRVFRSITATSFQRARAKVLLEQVRAELDNLRNGTDDWLNRTLPSAYKAGLDWQGVGLAQNDWAVQQVTFGLVQRQAVEALAASIAADCATAIHSVAPNIQSVFVQTQQALVRETEMQKLVAQEIVEGKGPKVLAREIAQTLKDGAVQRLNGAVPGAITPELTTALAETANGKFISIVCRDGVTRRYGLKNYSEMVARTSTRFAQTEGTLASCAQINVDLVQWSVHANPCARCGEIQGNVYSISGGNPDFPLLTSETRPPLHPNCAHVLTPAPEAFLRARGLYDKLSTFSLSDATVDNAMDYAALLEAA